MQPNDPSLINPFGEPLDPEILEDFAKVDAGDLESAVQWFDEHASEEWQGALENKPIGKKK